MMIRFDDNGDGHPVNRAISCANALLKMGKELVSVEHLPCQLRIAAAHRDDETFASQWCIELAHEACLNRLIAILPLASAWGLVIDNTDLSQEDMDGCVTEEVSASAVWHFRGYDAEHQENFDKQVAFISATLAP